MEAVQLDPKKHVLSHGTIDMPCVTKPDDVIIKVAYAGICGTDLHVIAGDYPSSQQPFTLGHEFCGTVYAVGSEVKNIKRGDRVAVDPNSGCGLCKYCHIGSYHLCPVASMNAALGIYCDGGWAQYCKVPARQVYKLPSTIPFDQAVLLEPLSCIYHGFTRISPLEHSKNILITGAGIAGNLWSSLLHHVGHRNVYVSEPEEARRELNKKLETGFQVLSPAETANKFTTDGLNGVDVCIDCSGNSKVIESNIQLLNRGGKLCIFGVASKEARSSVSPFDIFLRELTIYGCAINRYSFQHTIGLVEAMGSRYLDFNKLGVQVYTMSQYKEALEALRQRKISKAVFKIDSTAQ